MPAKMAVSKIVLFNGHYGITAIARPQRFCLCFAKMSLQPTKPKGVTHLFHGPCQISLDNTKTDVHQRIQSISKIDKIGLSPEFFLKLMDQMSLHDIS